MDEQKIHDVFPGWGIVRPIGSGSYGTVYEIARDDGIVRERAALKVITIPQSKNEIEELYDEGYDGDSVTATFKTYLNSIVKEYTMMRELGGSANVVKCDDIRYIQHDDGIGWDIYIRMELLTPLKKALGKTVNEAEVVRIGKDICRALMLCARRDIVHRDIKPENIFVSETGDYKLGDFGIARTMDKTTSATVAGTYDYMAPEVYYGKKYGASVDVYSLGMVLYWLLNERRIAFLKPSETPPSATEKEEARAKRLRGDPLPPPAHGSLELRRIVRKACAFEPRDRYRSAEELLEALEGMQQDGTLRIFPDDPPDDGTDDEPTLPPDYQKTVLDKLRTPPQPPEKQHSKLPLIAAIVLGAGVLILAAVLLLPRLSRSSRSVPAAETAAATPEPEPELLLQTRYTGLNVDRGTGALVVYDQSGSVANTNAYGTEIAVDSTGKIVAARYYGDPGKLTVPAGGFVLSGHRTSDGSVSIAGGGSTFVKQVLRLHDYDPDCRVEIDYVSGSVLVYGLPGAPELEYYDLSVRCVLGDGNALTAEDGCLFDVYINDELDAGDAVNYVRNWPVGTRYEIRNVRTGEGMEYLSTENNASLSGTLNASASIALCYQTTKRAEEAALLTSFAGSVYDYKKVPFVSAAATSEIYDAGILYAATNAVDGDLTTSWQEDVPGDGAGENLTLYFGESKDICLLSLRLGVSSNYVANSRPKTLHFEFSDGTNTSYTFEDSNREFLLRFSRTIQTNYVKLTIVDSYTGNKYDDTGITEVICYRQLLKGETPDVKKVGNSYYGGFISYSYLKGESVVQCAANKSKSDAEKNAERVVEKENSLGNSFEVLITYSDGYYMVCIPMKDYDTAKYQSALLNTTYAEFLTIATHY